MDEREKEKLIRLSNEILGISRNSLLVALRQMGLAFMKLVPKPVENAKFMIGTDGAGLYYNPLYVLNRYQKGKENIARIYLHLTLHCIFYHPFVGKTVNRDYWNLACDIAVENIINELDLTQTRSEIQQDQIDALEKLRERLPKLTAEKLYKFLREDNLTKQEMYRLAMLFNVDNHDLWYQESENKTERDNYHKNKEGKGKRKYGEDENDDDGEVSLSKDWQDISEKIKVDLETSARGFGRESNSMIQNITDVNREKYDYTQFLRQFTTLGEDLKINDDEFDYIFYTYGLSLYENLPLIEPLEYKEVRRIKEFVIAIDTSGSVKGDLVEKFITKTYNILKAEESFFQKINLHIVQCDLEIQEDVRITCQQDLDDYIENIELKGFGGTDFRPVFHYVDELIENGEFENLKGLIYFTDGQGIFPDKMPEYSAAFVFVGDEDYTVKLPPWAIKLVLSEDEI